MSIGDQAKPAQDESFGADEDLAKLGRTRWGWSFKQVMVVALVALIVGLVLIQFLPTGLSRKSTHTC